MKRIFPSSEELSNNCWEQFSQIDPERELGRFGPPRNRFPRFRVREAEVTPPKCPLELV